MENCVSVEKSNRRRFFTRIFILLEIVILGFFGIISQFPSTALAGESADTHIFVSHDYRTSYLDQPFVGNGYIGLRLPTLGDGYLSESSQGTGLNGWPLFLPRFTAATLARYYAGRYLATLPNWSPLTISDGVQTLDPQTVSRNEISEYQQIFDTRQGIVTTSFIWHLKNNNSIRITWVCYVHRVNKHLGLVRLSVRPLHWQGKLIVKAFNDLRGIRRAQIDHPGSQINPHNASTFTAVKSEVYHSPAVVGFRVKTQTVATITQLHSAQEQGLQWEFHPAPGQGYEFTKYVGIGDGDHAGQQAIDAIDAGWKTSWDALLATNARAWNALWTSDIIVDSAHRQLQRIIHMNEYLLYASTRKGSRASMAPAGLTSDSYAGMIFWDAETWIYPFFLATHPDLAKSFVDYRYDTLPAALRNVQQFSQIAEAHQGAFFPWTSSKGELGIDLGDIRHLGSLDDLAKIHLHINASVEQYKHYLATGGKTSADNIEKAKEIALLGDAYEIHLEADIALAQYQYYLTTGNKNWLHNYGWPVIKAIAEYYAARAHKNSDGSYSILHVDGPDEYTLGATDAAFTNGGAIVALNIAIHTAHLLGESTERQWYIVRDHLVKPIIDPQKKIVLQYKGFNPRHKNIIKQADTVLLDYPMAYPLPRSVYINNLNYYSAITDPLGPSMTNSVQAIVAAEWGLPSLDKFFVDSYQPYIKGQYQQFSETPILHPSAAQGNPAFSFLTGAGGFFQVFLYGFSGYRPHQDYVDFAPILPKTSIEESPLQKIKLSRIYWQHHIISLTITPQGSHIRLLHGQNMSVHTPQGNYTLTMEHALDTPTRTV